MIRIFKIKKTSHSRNTLMRKISFGMIPIIILGIFIAPISPIVKKAEAKSFADQWNLPSILVTRKTSTAVEGDVTFLVKFAGGTKVDDLASAYADLGDVFFMIIETTETDPDPFSDANIAAHKSSNTYMGRSFFDSWSKSFNEKEAQNTVKIATGDGVLKPDTYYAVDVVIENNAYVNSNTNLLKGLLIDPTVLLSTATINKPGVLVAKWAKFKTVKTGAPDDVLTGAGSITVTGSEGTQAEYSLECSLMGSTAFILSLGTFGTKANIGGCIAQVSYMFWGVSEMVAHLAGSFLDFFIYYSTNSASYSSEFLKTAWATVRDVANILFIIALLYVAIKTILNLNVTNNKKLISAIIIAALVINFSFFITEVVIDASNILAKVFYNQIQPAPGGGNQINENGQTSITEKLIKNFDPKSIVSEEIYKGVNGIGTFIFVCLLALAMTLYIAWIFFSVAFVFLARVISLWLAIIFSPLAFVSYSLPFKIPGFGHEDWWDLLLQNAFLAPLFIFFLYIVLLLSDFTATNIVFTPSGDTSTTTGLVQTLMSTLIPIVLCLVLMRKGKELAIKYSGEMGKAVNKVVGTITGTAGVGLAFNAAANYVGKGARATVGRAGSAVSKSQWAQKTDFGRWVGGKAETLSKSSFDLRGSKLTGKALSGISGSGYNLSSSMKGPKGVGGYEKGQADRTAKRMQAAERLKVGINEPIRKELRKSEKDLQEMLMGVTETLANLEKKSEVANKGALDAKSIKLAYKDTPLDPKYIKADADEKMFISQREAFKEHKNAIKQGKDLKASTTTYQERDSAGVMQTKNLSAVPTTMDYSTLNKGLASDGITRRTISHLENNEIFEIKRKISTIEATRMGELADNFDTPLNNILYGKDVTADAHKIRMKEELKSK